MADKIGDGSGVGQCAVFEAYLLKNPGKVQINEALRKLGNDPSKPTGFVFFGGGKKIGNRECEKYVGTEN